MRFLSRRGLDVVRRADAAAADRRFGLLVAVMLPGFGGRGERRAPLAGRGAADLPALRAHEARARPLRGAAASPPTRAAVTHASGIASPLLVVAGAACVLVAIQPDLGTALVIAFTLLRAAGRRGRAAAPPRLVRWSGRRGRARLRAARALPARAAHRLPEPVGRRRRRRASRRSRARSRSARAGCSASGSAQSVQKIFYLPEAHTDFILASSARSSGLAGVLGAAVPLRDGRLRRSAHRQGGDQGRYAKLLAAGLTSPDPLPGDPQRLRRPRPRAADRRAAAVHLLRLDQPDRAAGRDRACCSTSRAAGVHLRAVTGGGVGHDPAPMPSGRT